MAACFREDRGEEGWKKKEMPITCRADTNTANGECVEV